MASAPLGGGARIVGGTIAHAADDEEDAHRSEPGSLCRALARCLRDDRPVAKEVSSDDDDDGLVLRLEVAKATPPPTKADSESSLVSGELSQK